MAHLLKKISQKQRAPESTLDTLSVLREASPESSNAVPAAEEDLPDLDLLMSELANKPAPEPAPVVAQRPLNGLHDITLNTGTTTTAKEVLTILRDENDGRLLVQIGDKGYRTLKHETAMRQKFSTLMKELSQVIMTDDGSNTRKKAAESAPTSDEVHIAEPAAQSIPVTPEPPEPAPPVQSAPPPPARDGAMPGDLPSYKFDDNPAQIKNRRFSNPKVEFDAPPEVNIASAIESYLQHKIMHTPEYRGRGIHIRPALNGGVRIEVDGQSYDFVDEITDSGVRNFVQSAIAEWQERN